MDIKRAMKIIKSNCGIGPTLPIKRRVQRKMRILPKLSKCKVSMWLDNSKDWERSDS